MDEEYKMNKLKLIIIIITLSVFWGCSEKNFLDPQEDFERGDIISTFEIGTYSPEMIKNIFIERGLPDTFKLSYSVKITRVFYFTKDFYGNKIHISGSIINPVTDKTLPLLSMHHGTQTKRDNVVSQKPLELAIGLAGILTAAKGYVTVIPDYPGLGVSESLHPYLMAKGITPSVIDLIRAGKTFCGENNIFLNKQLFLTGYSEGGYVALATLKDIEKNYINELNVTATAPLGGVFDLHDVANTILSMDEFIWLYYIGYIFTAYNHYYNWNRLDDIFQAPYADMMEELYNGNYYDYEINNEFPRQMNQFIKPEFRQNFLNGNEIDFINAFKENSLLNWSSRSPILFIHGDQDISAPYSSAIKTIENLKQNTQSSIDLMTLEGLDHESAGLPAIIEMIKWFDVIHNHIP